MKKDKLIQFLRILDLKKIILFLFISCLLANYIFGVRYNILLSENLIYKNSFYPLLITWILLIWKASLGIKFLFKTALAICIISIIFFLLENRIVSEILLSYGLIIFLTITLISVKNIRNEK